MDDRPAASEQEQRERTRVEALIAEKRALRGAPVVYDAAAVQATLAALVDSSDDAIVTKDLNGTILTWNAGAERVFGYREEEVRGLPITILLPPERLAEEEHILATLREGRRIDHFETERITKAGRRIRISVSVSPIRDAAGRIIGAAKIARDITSRSEVERLRSLLAAIVESSDDAIVGKDLTGVIVSWNEGAERLFGYRADEIVGKSIMTLIPPDRVPEEERVLATLRAGRRVEHFETERVTKDGRRIEVSITVSPIRDANGEIIGASKIARDIGLRKSLEREREELLAREQLARAAAEAANRSKDAFLAMVSHELRTPLSPILAWTRMLLRGSLDLEKTRGALEVIDRNARNQAQLIDDLLDVSRIVAGKLRLEVRPVQLTDVIGAALDVVRPAADAKHIRLDVVLDTETGVISGDPNRLQQVVWNLLANAVKFTPKGGHVQVTLERVDSHVEVVVSDTGKGIAADFLPRLFERFQQAETGSSRSYGGLGLGLAIVRHIVELHGGTVAAASEGEDKGATFTVKLPRMLFARQGAEPARRHPTAETGAVDADTTRLDGVRILVVDDEPDSNEVVRAVFTLAGAEVRVAVSADDALTELVGWHPDVLVSDIGMPVEDGYALLRRVRRLEGEVAHTPAVALTAYGTTEDRVRIFSAGFQAHVVKPIEPAELTAVVASTVRRLLLPRVDG